MLFWRAAPLLLVRLVSIFSVRSVQSSPKKHIVIAVVAYWVFLESCCTSLKSLPLGLLIRVISVLVSAYFVLLQRLVKGYLTIAVAVSDYSILIRDFNSISKITEHNEKSFQGNILNIMKEFKKMQNKE